MRVIAICAGRPGYNPHWVEVHSENLARDRGVDGGWAWRVDEVLERSETGMVVSSIGGPDAMSRRYLPSREDATRKAIDAHRCICDASFEEVERRV